MRIQEATSAPDFTLPVDDGSKITLSTLQGRPVIVYFYPKADTSGCTRRACALKENFTAFAATRAVIIGVSKDPVSRLARFKTKYDLPFILASDAEGNICETYGVWVEKSMYGRRYMGIERSSFLIDGQGKLVKIWRKVKVPGHAEMLLKAVQEL